MKYKFLILLLPLFIFISCASIKKQEYFIPEFSDEIVDEDNVIRILQISDLHSNDYGKNQEKLISIIYEVKPDVVFFTGDIFEFSWPINKALNNVEPVIKAVSDICPFYYVSGNHEYYLGHDNEYAHLFSDYGGVVLESQVSMLEIKGVNFVIAGISDPISSLSQKERKKDAFDLEAYKINLNKLAETVKTISGDFYILLAHRPEFINEYLEYYPYDLILSGHAHGGQWKLFGSNGFYAPGQGLFPKYAGGRYDFSYNNEDNDELSSVFIISRGLSYQKPLFPRFGNPVELVEILVQTEAFRK